jgi:lytic murein transglycosylase
MTHRLSSHAIAAALAVCLIVTAATLPARADAAFRAWLEAQWPAAQSLGVSRQTFEAATHGLEPDLGLPDLEIPGQPEKPQRGQAEFVSTPAEYLSEKTLARLATQGRALLAEHRATLAAIEQRFGVTPSVLLAIWGRETDFGRYRLPKNAISVLATQAYLGRRKEQFRGEFLLALKMLQEGVIGLAEMRSSWAGAMGLTQFLPSEYYKYAVDFDGDGRRDIWKSVPDALASAANQLLDKGWQRGKRWGLEVRVPKDFDCSLAEPAVTAPVREWLKRGFAPAFDRKVAPADIDEDASVLLPAGTYGPGFLTEKNFYVLKEYNFSDLYALFVGDVSDRITGGRGFERPWDKVEQLRTADVERMQRYLTDHRLYGEKIDGKAGMKTRAALGAYQKANRLKLDCWPTASVLKHMLGNGR